MDYRSINVIITSQILEIKVNCNLVSVKELKHQSRKGWLLITDV